LIGQLLDLWFQVRFIEGRPAFPIEQKMDPSNGFTVGKGSAQAFFRNFSTTDRIQLPQLKSN
jgi:hypothetical protein